MPFAAGTKTSLRSLYPTQAIANAPELNNGMRIFLHRFPPELLDAGRGSAKGPRRVGHLKKTMYAHKQAGRTWNQYLMRQVIENTGARCYMPGLNAFTWPWANAPGSTRRTPPRLCNVLGEFFRRIAAAFAITGGEGIADFRGL